MNNFVFLANKGYYHCVIFHRVIPSFMDQTGDPTGTGTGGPREKKKKGETDVFIGLGGHGENTPHCTRVAASSSSWTALRARACRNRSSGMDVVTTINQQGWAEGVPFDVTQRIISITIDAKKYCPTCQKKNIPADGSSPQQRKFNA